MTSLKKTRAPRRDAIERREALIAAADLCFSESGYLIPLEDVALRAGVGRGTLYRNFKDRVALTVAVFERRTASILATIDPATSLEDAFATFLREGAHASALFIRLTADISADADSFTALSQVGRKFEQALQPMIEQAKKSSLLAKHIGAREVQTAMLMLGGLARPDLCDPDIDEEIAGGIALVMNGLRPR